MALIVVRGGDGLDVCQGIVAFRDLFVVDRFLSLQRSGSDFIFPTSCPATGENIWGGVGFAFGGVGVK